MSVKRPAGLRHKVLFVLAHKGPTMGSEGEVKKKPRRKKGKLTFVKWLRTLSNEIINRLDQDWRRDVLQSADIRREFTRRLKLEKRDTGKK